MTLKHNLMWLRHTILKIGNKYNIVKGYREICETIDKLQEELEQPTVLSKKMKLWLDNNEELPLQLKVEMCLGLFKQEILGEKPK